MVGIPRQSNGCHTCRRRKVKCDLQEPHCLRCKNSGRTCEGYQRGAIFLNRTQEGLQKRQRLEEILPTPPRPSTYSSNPIFNDNLNHLASDAIPVPVNSYVAVMQRFQGLFIETYFPSYPDPKTSVGSWVYEAICVQNPGKALEYTLQAIFTARAGRMIDNQSLINHGRVIYGSALRELQKALWDEELSTKDETLAACNGCALFEVFESTSDSLRGTEDHASGITRLIEHRGNRPIESSLGEALIEEIAYGAMIRSLQHRKASRIKDLLPNSRSWGSKDRPKHDICLLGFELGAIIEDMDQMFEMPHSSNTNQLQSELVNRLLALDRNFDSWYKDYIGISPIPIFWLSEPDFQSRVHMNFRALHNAHHMLDFWALQLALGATILQLGTRIGSVAQSGGLLHIAQLQQLQQKQNPAKLMIIATNIMTSMPYCMSAEHGVVSSQKCLFAGRAALHILQRFGAGQYEDCIEVYLDLNRKKGLKFARDMATAAGKWKGSLD